jgi:hypothetical protein
MAVASLIISIIALGFTGWNMVYRYRVDRRERWWARITWALDKFSAETARPRDRRLAWSLLTFYITQAPVSSDEDDLTMLDALDDYLSAIENDEVNGYDETNPEE